MATIGFINKKILKSIFGSNPSRGLLAILTFLLIVCSRLIWIFQGFDMTDEGYNLTNQWLLINHKEKMICHNWMTYLSDLAGGIWLKIGGDAGLIWARLGWVLIISLTGLVVFLILIRYFHPFASFFAILATALASGYHGIMTINYNNFPSLILICTAGFLLISQERVPLINVRHNRQMLFAILGGILLGSCVIARFPLILSLSLSFLLPLAHALLDRNMKYSKYCWSKAFVSLAASFMVISCYSILFPRRNHLWDNLNMIYRTILAQSGSHNLATLLHRYRSTSMSAAIWGSIILASGFVIAYTIVAICHQFKWHRMIAVTLFSCLFFSVVCTLQKSASTISWLGQ